MRCAACGSRVDVAVKFASCATRSRKAASNVRGPLSKCSCSASGAQARFAHTSLAYSLWRAWRFCCVGDRCVGYSAATAGEHGSVGAAADHSAQCAMVTGCGCGERESIGRLSHMERREKRRRGHDRTLRPKALFSTTYQMGEEAWC